MGISRNKNNFISVLEMFHPNNFIINFQTRFWDFCPFLTKRLSCYKVSNGLLTCLIKADNASSSHKLLQICKIEPFA